MAKLSNEEINKLLAKQADLQKKIGSSVNEYVGAIKELGETYKHLETLQNQLSKEQENQKELGDELNDLLKKRNKGTDAQIAKTKKLISEKIKELKVSKQSAQILKQDVKTSKEQIALYEAQVKSVNKLNLALKGTQNTLNASSKLLRKGLLGGFKKLSRSGAMGWSQDIKDAQLNMGITNKHAQSFAKSITNAGLKTSALGVNAGDLAKAQAAYSTELGRAIELGQDGLVAITEMGMATGLGAEGAAAMVGELDKFNVSALGAKEVIQETVDSATVLGLNSSKVIKQLQGNLKLAQKYHFKGGVKGMASMAQYATKMGVDMGAMAGAADKAFRPEGAVEMSARLQTMGGAFAQIADPFTLMFKARNDFEGFSKDIGKAAAELATFNTETGEFEISGLQLDRLKEISKMTGVAEADLSQMALAGAKFNRIKTFLPPMMTKEDQELLSNVATVGEDGGYEVKIGVDGKGVDIMKDVRDLTEKEMKLIRRDKEALDERVKNSQSFAKKWDNLMMSFQTLLLPLINRLNDYLGPIIEKFSGALTGKGGFGEVLMGVSEDIGEMIGKSAKKISDEVFGEDFFSTLKTFAQKIGSFVGVIADFVKENPKLTAALVGVLALGGPIMSLVGIVGKFLGGMGSLVRGISSIFSKGGGGGGNMMGRMGGKGRGGMMGRMGGLNMGLGIAGLGMDIGKSFVDDKNSVAYKGLDIGSSAAYGAALGGMILLGWGHAIGGALGAGKGLYDNYGTRQSGGQSTSAGNIGYATGTSNITKPGLGIVGEKGPELMGLSKGTSITPNNGKGGFSVDVKPISVNGTITLQGNNGQTLDNDILKDPMIKREITKLVQEGISSAIGGGKLNPSA